MRYRAMTDAMLEELSAAVVWQAVKDYRRPDLVFRAEKKKKAVRKEVLKFFHSDWYRMLCSIDPECIIMKLKEENGTDTCKQDKTLNA